MLDDTEFGKYRLVQRLAVGGMAEVFLAEIVGAEGFTRQLVIKRILPQNMAEPQFRRMFVDEARLAARLHHPNIVQIFDFDLHQATYYLAMEYVRGADLGRVLSRCRELGRPLSLPEIVTVGVSVLAALDHAHTATDDGKLLGVVHRDVTPHNILLSLEGAVKLADFGIAKARDAVRGAETGGVKGKYPYMAPEALSGEEVSPASDIFSTGVVLYQMLAGRRPFDGATEKATVDAILSGDPPARLVELRPEVPASVADLVHRCLERVPEDRPKDAATARSELLEAAEDAELRTGPDCIGALLEEVLPDEAVTPDKPRPSGPSTWSLVEHQAGPDDVTSAQRPSARRAVTRRMTLRRWLLPVGALLAAAALVAAAYLALPRGRQEAAGGGEAAPLVVLLRMADRQEAWFVDNLLRPFARQEGCPLRVVSYGPVTEVFEILRRGDAVDLVKVHSIVSLALARSGLLVGVEQVLRDSGHDEDLPRLREAFVPEAVALAEIPTLVGRDFFYVPRKVETRILVYRRSAVAAAVAAFPELRPGIEEALRPLNGRGLPRGYALEADPNEWDSYDVLVVGYIWAHTPDESGVTRPRIARRGHAYRGAVTSLLDSYVQMGGDLPVAARSDQAMVDVFVWESVFRELDLYAPEVWADAEVMSGRGIYEVMARGGAHLLRTHSLGVRLLATEDYLGSDEDLGLAVMPQGVSFELDDEGRPARVGTRRSTVNGWVWGVPASAPDPLRSVRLARYLSDVEQQQAEVDVFSIQPARAGVSLRGEGLPDRMEPLFRRQLALAEGALEPRGNSLEAVEEQERRVAQAWRTVLLERGYRSERAERPVDAERIRRLLDEALGQ